jgi:hypothetical protein
MNAWMVQHDCGGSGVMTIVTAIVMVLMTM